MSLETDIQNLTKAIEGLTAALTKAPVQLDVFKQPANCVVKIAEELKSEPMKVDFPQKTEVQTTEALQEIQEPVEESEKSKSYTFEELQSACAALIQKDLNNKALIRNVLDSFKAKILRDLKESQYADFMAQIGSK